MAFDSTKRGTESTETYRNPNFLGWETNLKSIIYNWLVFLTILKNMKVNGKDYPIFWKIEFMFRSTNQNIITSINGEKSPQSRINPSDPMPSSHVHLHISNDQRWPRLSVEIVHGRICHHFNSREECANRDGLQQNHVLPDVGLTWFYVQRT